MILCLSRRSPEPTVAPPASTGAAAPSSVVWGRCPSFLAGLPWRHQHRAPAERAPRPRPARPRSSPGRPAQPIAGFSRPRAALPPSSSRRQAPRREAPRRRAPRPSPVLPARHAAPAWWNLSGKMEKSGPAATILGRGRLCRRFLRRGGAVDGGGSPCGGGG